MAEFNELTKELSQAMSNTVQFANLTKALQDVKDNQEAFDIFQKFQDAQSEIQTAQTTGKQPTEDQINNWRSISEKAQNIELIKKLSEAEMGINELLQQVNDEITKPLTELYQ
ncbi:MAG: YlbF family regulator [Lactobacillaceae bacterium]|jgi:cell fate (sporulation/competence/biofilm development) regulator YlbF (YheA/YmcA/DUF963 family)|nr:YlbF family regulator [Lactobacillaceae bacterium]